jgi:hypothetical protein
MLQYILKETSAVESAVPKQKAVLIKKCIIENEPFQHELKSFYLNTQFVPRSKQLSSGFSSSSVGPGG